MEFRRVLFRLYNVEKVRKEFPILERIIKGKPFIYLDNAATAQKPRQIIETLDRFYKEYNANIHRGIYKVSEEATAAHEEARAKVARFINARSPNEIVFVRGPLRRSTSSPTHGAERTWASGTTSCLPRWSTI